MRRSSPYTSGASSSMAAWSPPPHARSKRVISGDEAVSMAGTHYIGIEKKAGSQLSFLPSFLAWRKEGEDEIHWNVVGDGGHGYGRRNVYGKHPYEQFVGRAAG